MKIPAKSVLTTLFLLSSAYLPAQITYQLNGNSLNFKAVGASELELQPCDYSGELICSSDYVYCTVNIF